MVPPETEISIAPSANPLQLTLVCDSNAMARTSGSVIVNDSVSVQFCESVTVTE